MPRIRAAEQALSLVASSSARPQYICRACRAHAATRQFHTTRLFAADVGFFKRIQQSLFGGKKNPEQEAQAKKQVEERAKADAEKQRTGQGRERKGRGYEVAAVYDPSINPEYVMANKWDELERVGGEKWVTAQKDQGVKYKGFNRHKPAELEDEQWLKVLRYVAVKVRGRQRIGQDALNANLGLQTLPAVLELPTDGTKSLEKWAYAASRSSQGPGSTSTASATRASHTLDPETTEKEPWLAIPLQDPMVKFAITKRVTQLTGHRLRDPTISSARTLADLYTAYKTKAAPKKLAKTAEMMTLRESAPNVTVKERRQTPIHKEKAIGRWKVIEEELIARDLPVTGTRWKGARPSRIALTR